MKELQEAEVKEHHVMIAQIERAVEEETFTLTDWETDFVEKIKGLGRLTPGQDEKLEEIWEKATQ